LPIVARIVPTTAAAAAVRHGRHRRLTVARPLLSISCPLSYSSSFLAIPCCSPASCFCLTCTGAPCPPWRRHVLCRRCHCSRGHAFSDHRGASCGHQRVRASPGMLPRLFLAAGKLSVAGNRRFPGAALL
jgi:hypothetical protein